MSNSEVNKWESNSEEMEDEDLIMEENEEDEDDEERYEHSRGKVIYPEEFVGSLNNMNSHMFSRFSRNQSDFSRLDMSPSANSPLHDWSDAIDEKSESVALMMHLEKTTVHQKFFNNFDDDFDEDDLA